MTDPYRRLRTLVFAIVLLTLAGLLAVGVLWVRSHYTPIFDMVPIGTNPSWGAE
jgi:hypothetical protein